MPQSLEQITSALNQELPESAIEKRDGQDYLPGWYVIETANDVFGPLGWSYEITRTSFEGGGQTSSGTPWKLWSAQVRVTVYVEREDGDLHQVTRHDVGGATMYGDEADVEGQKAASTVALKRCLRSFGERFGNLLYSDDYRQKKEQQKRSARRSGGQQSSGRRSAGRSGANGGYERTKKAQSGDHMSAKPEQVTAIERLAKEWAGRDNVPTDQIVASINRRADDIFDDPYTPIESLEELTFHQAKNVIQYLQ